VPVVGNFQFQVPGITAKRNSHPIGPTVLNRIADGLLHDPQKLQSAFGIQMFKARLSWLQTVNFTVHTAGGFKRLPELFEPRGELVRIDLCEQQAVREVANAAGRHSESSTNAGECFEELRCFGEIETEAADGSAEIRSRQMSVGTVCRLQRRGSNDWLCSPQSAFEDFLQTGSKERCGGQFLSHRVVQLPCDALPFRFHGFQRVNEVAVVTFNSLWFHICLPFAVFCHDPRAAAVHAEILQF
jgi:hypothetical protein